MKRSDLKRIVERVGGRVGKGRPKVKKTKRKTLEDELRKFFQSPEGQRVLARAPQVYWQNEGLEGMKPMDEEYAIRALLEEVEDEP